MNQNQKEGVNPPEGKREIWWKYWILVMRFKKKKNAIQDKELQKSIPRLMTFSEILTVK